MASCVARRAAGRYGASVQYPKPNRHAALKAFGLSVAICGGIALLVLVVGWLMWTHNINEAKARAVEHR